MTGPGKHYINVCCGHHHHHYLFLANCSKVEGTLGAAKHSSKLMECINQRISKINYY